MMLPREDDGVMPLRGGSGAIPLARRRWCDSIVIMPNGVILLETVDRRWCDTIVVEGVGVRPATMV